MEVSFMNLGEEVILTLLWQSGASESVTVCFIISLSICYWLFKYWFLRVLCVCVWEREWETHTGSHHSPVRFLNRSLFANTYKYHYCVCHVTLLHSRAWTDGKSKNITNCIYIYFESIKLAIMERGVTFPTPACGVWPITMLWVCQRRGFVENNSFERGRA